MTAAKIIIEINLLVFFPDETQNFQENLIHLFHGKCIKRALPGPALVKKQLLGYFHEENVNFGHVRVAKMILNFKLGLKPAANGQNITIKINISDKSSLNLGYFGERPFPAPEMGKEGGNYI